MIINGRNHDADRAAIVGTFMAIDDADRADARLAADLDALDDLRHLVAVSRAQRDAALARAARRRDDDALFRAIVRTVVAKRGQ